MRDNRLCIRNIRNWRKPTDEELYDWLRPKGVFVYDVLRHPTTILISVVGIIVVTVLGMKWCYRMLTGYYDTFDPIFKYDTQTNWTLGFAIFWPAMGFFIGLYLSKVIGMRGRFIYPLTFVLLMIIAYLFSMMGFEGFRFSDWL